MKYCRHVFTHIELLTLLCSCFLTEEGVGFKLRKHRRWQDSQEPSHSLRDREQLLSLEEWPASWAGGSRDAFENWYPCCCLEVTHALVNSPDTWIIKLDVWELLFGLYLLCWHIHISQEYPTADMGSDSGSREMQWWSLVGCCMATVPAVPPHHGRARISSPCLKNQTKSSKEQ